MVMGEAAAVEAYFSMAGEIIPRRFTWRGGTLVVEGVGRRWREGNQRCFAVLAAGGHPFDLRLDEETLCWRVRRRLRPRPSVGNLV
jgi:hypothetical protein